jgi:hypothetical protein
VLAVEAVQLLAGGDVELGGVHVLAGAGHANESALRVLRMRLDLVLKEASLVAVQDPAGEASPAAVG